MKLAPYFLIAVSAAVGLFGCSKHPDTTDDHNNTAAQETTTLRFSYYWPGTSNMSKEVSEPWAEKIAKERLENEKK